MGKHRQAQGAGAAGHEHSAARAHGIGTYKVLISSYLQIFICKISNCLSIYVCTVYICLLNCTAL